jgi:hypothetical protein
MLLHCQHTSVSDSTLISVPKSGGYVQLIAAPAGTPLPNSFFITDAWNNYYPRYWTLDDFLTANPGWALASSLDGTPAPPTPIAAADGIFSGGTQTINNVAAGAQAGYLVLGWTGNFSSYEVAYAAATQNPNPSFLGVSAVATTATGNPTTTPTGPPVLLSSTFPGMTLAPLRVPEPTAVVLAGLGAAAVMVFRRRR